jgi:MscS family membrane protein
MAMLEQFFFGNSVLAYLEFLGIVLGSVLAGKLVTWTTETFLKKFAKETETKLDDLLLHMLEGPILLSILIGALHYGQGMLVLSEGFASFYSKTVMVMLMFNIAWYLMRFLNGLIEYYLAPLAAKTESDLDDHLLPILKRLVSIVIVIITLIMALDKFDFNVGGLLAGLGLGGLAFALAAKDVVENLFGGVSILTDKPFKMGDRIRVGNDVDGIVREIGLRTTRVETAGGTLVILPNSKVVTSVVENITAEKSRRMVLTLGLEYDTSAQKLEQAKTIVKKNVKRISGLRDDCQVTFKEFAASSLNVQVIYWITKESVANRFWEVQDELLTGIKQDFEKAHIEFAYPTQTVRVKK